MLILHYAMQTECQVT